MSIPSIPEVTLSTSEHRRLERLARVGAAQGDADARLLLSEIRRAEIVPDRAARLDSIVTMGSWVTFWINWGFPRETRQLVYPEDYASERTQIPVMSPLGAALVGLKVGSEIPFFTAGRSNVVRIESVSRTDPNDVVRVLFSNPMFQGKKPFDDDDPGPSAA
ncbi:GreA/GreB family elongation factor [Bradyrhizobium liaoningense]|uniref:GreA/GreB family elongation factor n=1 Tax=Bradyrhizobium liaoningense TaxID=43992 RepID=UPI001BAACBF4|nr:GreA/GreB family elongation factor [Bradyrhizobium liaoningense]MBR0718378.1 GreA/GreB family elongation factor [Bradyrhizobium liaoningense]